MNPIRQHARVLTASLAGTAVEFYDFYIYATAAALVFGPLFFPEQSPAAQLALSFLTFGIAFFARPVGAVVFGHFGDRVGRKSTLVASLLMMGGSTLAIAFLPTYAQAGWIAPALLCLMRFGQGFGLGGEWGGAALLAVENAPKGWEARFGSAPQFGAPVGFLAANGLFLVLGLWLSDADFRAWGWRVPFLLSAVLVGLGLWVRLKIGETPQFREALEQERPPAVPLARLLADHAGTLLAGTAGAVACFAIFYLATAYALAQGTGVLGHSREAFLGVQLAANLFLALGIAVAAVMADRNGARRTLLLGATGDRGGGLRVRAGAFRALAVDRVCHAIGCAVRHGLRLRAARRMAADTVPAAGALFGRVGGIQPWRHRRRRADTVRGAGNGSVGTGNLRGAADLRGWRPDADRAGRGQAEQLA